MKINKQNIKKLLKQQKPFLFVDEAKIVSDNKIIGKFDLTKNAEILNGHFPNFPILPGVIAIEMIAQTSLILSAFNANTTNDKYETYFVKLNSFTFKNFITPPAKLGINVEIKPSQIKNYYEASGFISQDKKRKCFGSMIFYFKTNH